jgi:iron complex outermembrane recepter protein
VNFKYRITRPQGDPPHTLILGVDWLKENVDSHSLSDDFSGFIFEDTVQYERRVIGAYAHYDLSVTPIAILSLSGRMDWSEFESNQESTGNTVDRSFRLWSPKVGLTYRTSPVSSLFATWSESFRFPNRDELTGFFGFAPELDPERATTYEIGSTVRMVQTVETTVSFFQSTVENEILFNPIAFENQNIDEVQHEGIELSTQFRYTPSVRLRGSYTFTRTEILEGPFKGGELPITPKHAGAVTLDWGRRPGWILSVTGRFTGARYLANDLDNDLDKLPKYSAWDAKLSYFGDSFEYFMGVNNLMNREYDDFGGVNGPRIGFNPAPERNYLGGVTLRF